MAKKIPKIPRKKPVVKSSRPNPKWKPKPKPKKVTRTAAANKVRTGKAEVKARRYAEEYVANGGNKAAAARAAGSRAKNATQAANEIMRKPETQTEIETLVAEARTQKVLTARQVLERLSEQALFDPTKYLAEDGSVDLAAIKRDGVGHLFQHFNVRTTRLGTKVTYAQPYSHQKVLGILSDCLGLKMAPKANEFDALCESLRRYCKDMDCSLAVALDKLGHLDIVARYREQILERGIV